jgi:perosamine synthetase
LNPVPVEVGSDLNLLPSAVRRRLDRHSLAVIGVHMYGCPAHLAEIEDTCRTVGAYLLDDAAHTIGCEPAGKPLGLAGDVGVLSFNQLKTITTGVAEGAGAIILNNPALAARIDTAVGELNDPSFSLWGVMRFICEYQLEAQTGRLFYYARRWLRRTPVPRTEYMVGRRLSAQSCAIGLAQLDRLEEIRAERMRIAQAYFEYLRPQHDVLMPQFSPGRYLSRIVVRFRDKTRRDSVRTALARIGVVSRLPYRAWCDASDPAYLASRELEEQLLELPSPLGMAESEVRDIASVMRWAAC